MLNIAVVFGGKSVEHDISVITGTLTLNSLDKSKFNAIAIYVDREGCWWTGDANSLKAFSKFNCKYFTRVTFKLGENFLYLIKGKKLKKDKKIDCIINCTHGYNGEDGSISALSKLCNVALASPDIASSCVSIDKELTKIVCRGITVKTLPYKVCYRDEFNANEFNCLSKLKLKNFPVIVKPARLGSSIGIGVAKTFKELCSCCGLGFKYDDKLLIEPLIEDFIEINCACYKAEELMVSECERVTSTKQILTFEDKYEGKGKREFPAKIDNSLKEKIQNITKKVYSALGFSGIIRIDYIVKDNEIYLNEINSIPGSMAYYLFCNTFKEFSSLLESLINLALKENENYQINNFNLNSKILLDAGNLKK